MGESDEQFIEIGDAMVRRFSAVADLRAARCVVDIGCGYGRIGAALRRSADFHGTYHGYDMLQRHIRWCNDRLGGRRFRYHYMDIHSERYNPDGTLQQSEVRFDLPDGTADLIILTSVFTHMYPDDISHYLGECRRLLAAGGRIYATFFVMNDRQASRPNRYPLPHELTPFCRCMSTDDPLHVIAYSEGWLRDQFDAAGLAIDGDIRLGSWSGEPEAFDFQDTVILTRRDSA